jgi:hypothetical protein
LVQRLASHEENLSYFLRSNLPIYHHPFLHTNNKSEDVYHFKLAVFGVIGSLSNCDHSDVVNYLLNNEFLPLRLFVPKFCVGIFRTVSMFTSQRLMNHPDGHREFIQRPKRNQNCV